MKVSGLGCFVMCVSFLLLGDVTVARSPQGRYHLLKKVPLSAAPGDREYFDCITVDAPARRVYTSHGTEVKVVNADSGAVVGMVSDLKQDHGIALVKELGKGFISDGGADRVVIFDLDTLKVTGEVKTGGNPAVTFHGAAARSGARL